MAQALRKKINCFLPVFILSSSYYSSMEWEFLWYLLQLDGAVITEENTTISPRVGDRPLCCSMH